MRPVEVEVIQVTDPASPQGWGAEPLRRQIGQSFGAGVRWRVVLSGLAREVDEPARLALELLDAAAASGMPVDARGWLADPPRSTYPACLAVLAAREQGRDASLLRVLREGFCLRRRRPDSRDALLAAAREVPGLDTVRFGVALESSATLEAFGDDLAWAREHHAGNHAFFVAGERVAPEGLAPALEAAGATPGSVRPGVAETLQDHGPLAGAEVAALCRLPLLRVTGELWRLALELGARAEPVGSGELWHPG